MVDDEARDFLFSLNLSGVRLVWEYRGQITPDLIGLMQDFNIVHSVDLSRQKPCFKSNVTYSRLFGKGQQNIYQFTDDELAEIEQNAEETGSTK